MRTCVTINENKNSELYQNILNSYFRANQFSQNIPEWLLNMESMSGKKYKNLTNSFISQISDARYLEIGTGTKLGRELHSLFLIWV